MYPKILQDPLIFSLFQKRPTTPTFKLLNVAFVNSANKAENHFVYNILKKNKHNHLS